MLLKEKPLIMSSNELETLTNDQLNELLRGKGSKTNLVKRLVSASGVEAIDKMTISTEKNKKCEYEKLTLYCNPQAKNLNFDFTKEPTITEFSNLIGEDIYLAGRCVLNTPDNFPYKINKDGTKSKVQREYLEDNPNYTGKKVDYLAVDETIWNDNNNEWLYLFTYNSNIVKIGMTTSSLKERMGSYCCGTSRAMSKGSCSTTNFILSECNYIAIYTNINVEIYALYCPKQKTTLERFGEINTVYASTARDQETILCKLFHKIYKHKPVFCVQEGD